MPSRVSLITLTHNKLDCTRTCLESWLQSSCRPLEIVVVDNGSTDGTHEWLVAYASRAAAAGVEFRLLRNPANIGCSTARNQGIDHASGDFVVFLDNDVALRTRSWIENLLEPFENDPALALAGPKLVYPEAPFRIQCAGVGISATGRVLFRGRGEPNDAPEFNRAMDAQCLISACLMVRRSVLSECGGFDEAFNPVQFEDFDLCYRIRSRGYRALYMPAVEMYHFESVTTADTLSLPNTAVVIRHGLLFKQRWQHMFAVEKGPADSETAWRRVPRARLPASSPLPIVDTPARCHTHKERNPT